MSEHDGDATSRRTRMIGSLRASHAGRRERLGGWVHRRRDLGGLLFFDLRDRSGIVQVSVGPEWTDPDALERAGEVGHEDVLEVEGEVVLRPDEARNPEMETGDVELRAFTLRVVGDAETPAIPVYRGPDDALPAEELRLRHRVLDLRRPELQRNLLLRHRLVLEARNVLDRLGFVEVETPILTRPTPEGARDYLVPSRNHPGECFALPQSPQIYKQVLMAAGIDRYFQIARCFRDEDLRADRQPEFTQIDVEASFIERDDLLGWIEELMDAMSRVGTVVSGSPFPRFTHREALERFGSDRPDLRVPLEIQDWTDALAGLEFRIFRRAVEEGGRIRGLLVKGGASLSRRELDGLEGVAKDAGAPGLLWLKRDDGGGSGPLARFMEEGAYASIEMRPGDLALLAAGPDAMTGPALGAVRPAAARAAGIEPGERHAWAWVVDFPLFEEDEETGGLMPAHHPFVLPHPDDRELLDEDPLAARSVAYDLVYNGSELGSGSLRIHEPKLQRRIFRLLGLDEEEVERKFGFLLEALAAGVPPHGGIALGMDRIVKEFSGAPSLRDVIAFPKTTAARGLFEGAPAPVTEAELAALHLRRAEAATEPA